MLQRSTFEPCLRGSWALLCALLLAAGGSACAPSQDRAAGAAEESAEGGSEARAEAREEPGFFARIFGPERVEVPAGTRVAVRLRDTASSHTSGLGEAIRAEVVNDVMVDRRVAIPAGSTLIGRVSDAHRPKIGGRARLRVDFESVQLPSGESEPFPASVALVGKSEAGKDAAAIAGGTAAGAILGHQVEDDDEGKVVGGVVGGGIGAAIAARTKGRPLVLAAGTVINLELESPVVVEIEA